MRVGRRFGRVWAQHPRHPICGPPHAGRAWPLNPRAVHTCAVRGGRRKRWRAMDTHQSRACMHCCVSDTTIPPSHHTAPPPISTLVQLHVAVLVVCNKPSASERAHGQVNGRECVCGGHSGVHILWRTHMHSVRHHFLGVPRHSIRVSCASSQGVAAEETAGVGCVHPKTTAAHCVHACTHICTTHLTHPIRPFPRSCGPIRCCRPCTTRSVPRSERTGKPTSSRERAGAVWA